MSGQENTYQKIAQVLVELFEIDPDAIHPDANLYADLDIDSIDAVDLVVELKKMTGKKIKPEDFKSVRTVQDVVTEVEKLLD
ncbi:MAG: acyl carrier protein [Oceanospirillales bacterium]|uniref:Acyl carrier protein n=1 Tax=Marinobacterium halophilum TaxID=267374 RepID=A0A2P8F4M6_9GAMM|nr:acyl carrier protein [Marinobacterium halophilum]MBR9828045.1 acyl carrier protein [Oceanospirillales bacterium]PSL16636.1 acyl carrier protein [Marinobacterium halophilum]